MIVVIADDVTGAAELAGVALRCQLSVEVVTELPSQSQPDVLIVATDTRSKKEKEAIAEITNLTAKVMQLKPRLLFKKIDSVLRGHVLPEVKAQLAITGLKSALIVPCNPDLNRIIVNGHYYYEGHPIHLSSFSHDPEFPIRSSFIPHMLKSGDEQVTMKQPVESLGEGITVGEVIVKDDLEAWAAKDLSNHLIVGGAGFFAALLKQNGHKHKNTRKKKDLNFHGPSLFISGTSFGKSRSIIKQLKNANGPISYMPPTLFTSNNELAMRRWCEKIRLLLQQRVALIAIDADSTIFNQPDAVLLRQQTARAVKCVLDQSHVSNLFIEGGSTASAVLQQAGINRLVAVNEIAPGVIHLYSPEQYLNIIIKPGSYDWPGDVWALITAKQLTPYEQSKLAPN